MAKLIQLALESDDNGNYIEAPISCRIIEVDITAAFVLLETPDGDDEDVRIPLLVLLPDDEIPDGAQFITTDWTSNADSICGVYRGVTD